MTRSAKALLTTAIESFVVQTVRHVARELRLLVLQAEAKHQGELRKLERRLERLERRLEHHSSRTNAMRPGAKPCKRDGCGEAALARGLCSRHYQQMRYRKLRRRSS